MKRRMTLELAQELIAKLKDLDWQPQWIEGTPPGFSCGDIYHLYSMPGKYIRIFVQDRNGDDPEQLASHRVLEIKRPDDTQENCVPFDFRKAK